MSKRVKRLLYYRIDDEMSLNTYLNIYKDKTKIQKFKELSKRINPVIRKEEKLLLRDGINAYGLYREYMYMLYYKDGSCLTLYPSKEYLSQQLTLFN